MNDWEVEGILELLYMIEGFQGANLETDRLLWRQHPHGRFSVNRLCKWGLSIMVRRMSGPWSVVWESVAPAKVKCFVLLG